MEVVLLRVNVFQIFVRERIVVLTYLYKTFVAVNFAPSMADVLIVLTAGQCLGELSTTVALTQNVFCAQKDVWIVRSVQATHHGPTAVLDGI